MFSFDNNNSFSCLMFCPAAEDTKRDSQKQRDCIVRFFISSQCGKGQPRHTIFPNSRSGNSASSRGCIVQTMGQYTHRTRETWVIGSYIESIIPGLIRLKTLAVTVQWPTKTERAISLHFGRQEFSKLKANNPATSVAIEGVRPFLNCKT